MNCLKYFLLLGLFSPVVLQAFEVKTTFFDIGFSRKGAVINSLKVKGKNWLCSVGKIGSFTDRIGQNLEKELQGVADTSKIDFNITKHTVSRAGTQVTFSSCVGVLPQLRIEKSYFFSGRSPQIIIDYRLTNLGSKPLPLSLYVRSFLRSSTGKSFYYRPGAKGIELIQAGETTIPVKLPALTFLAVADETGAGFIHRFPADDTAGLLNWILKGGGYTQEFLSSQRDIAPGKSRSIRIQSSFVDNVAAALKKGGFNAKKFRGIIPVQVDRMCRIKPKARLQFYGSIPVPEQKFIDLTFRRQPDDSWRAVELPPGQEKSPVAIYALENGVIAPDRPLEFARKGKNIVVKIPGLFNRRIYLDRCLLENDLVFYKSLKRWCGPLTMKCRLFFNTAGGKEIKAEHIPAEGALILNGSMEKLTKGTLKEKSGNTVLRISKSLFFNFFPEHRKEYHFSVRARSVGGLGLTRIFIQFYDKEGKYLQKQRLLVLADRKTFGWKKFERRFYIPDNAAFLRILFLNGQAKGQYLDIDDLKLTLPPESSIPVDRKQILRDEMSKLWMLPLELLENISHELVTPHKKWFKPADMPVSDILFLSGVSGKITYGRRRAIVELAQRMDLKYNHIPLIPAIKSMVRAYSVYPTYFYPRLSDYSMEQLKTVKKRPQLVCFTGVNFRQLKNKEFISFLSNWQKKGVNFLFYRCSAIPKEILGKRSRIPLKVLLPEMSPGPGRKAGSFVFYRNGKVLNATIGRHGKSNSIIPAAQSLQAQYDYAMPYSFEFPWWEYNYLQDLHVLRTLAGIKPAARLTKVSSGIAVKAEKNFKGTLEICIEDMHRELILKKKLPVTLSAGKRLIVKDSFDLPGGIYVADLRLLDPKGRVVDAGAVKLERKEITSLSVVMKNKENIVPYPQKAEFTVNAPNAPADTFLDVEIFNQDKATLFRTRKKAEAGNSFSVTLPSLQTFLNYIRVKLIRNGKIIASAMQEFSVPQIPLEMDEFYGFINAGASGGAPIKDLGFDFAITGDPRWRHTPLIVRRMRTMGLHPIPRRGDEKFFLPYRSDVKTDPVRNPCFTSASFHTQLRKDTKYMAENCRMRYYDVNMLWAGDEMFLGRSVCTSPSCLAGFRKEMAKQFGSIDALNKNWGTSFKNFAEVVPQQLEEVKDKNRLGPWLDHKMYMTRVFAENFFGKAKDELGKYVPNVKIGPTGTQIPGFGYNWHELMKYCRIAGYYYGVQTKLVHDLADDTVLAGQCGGGYTHGHIDYEPYNYNTMWTTLLNGGNLAYHYYGCAISGDGSATRNMRFYTTSLKELKSGIGRIYLSARPRYDVAILYSQASLFTAMGSCGQADWQNSQTSWTKLLDDLRISARFISYEELAVKGVPAGIKVMVLPFALALSDAEIASLKRFSDAGGMVIADCNTALFDEHGRKRSEKERNEKLAFLNSLRYSIARYSFVQHGGTGGETASSGSGDAGFIKKCRKDVMAMLKKKGITPFVKLTDERGNEFGCMAKQRFDGATQIYGFHISPENERSNPGRFKDSDGKTVFVTLPAAGHVFDIRNKKYLGKISRWKMLLIPGRSLIYAVTPVRPLSVKAELPAVVSRGKSFKVKATVTPAKGAQVFRLTLAGPDGRELPRCSGNFRTKGNSGERELFIPFNAPRGKYKVKLIHPLSNLSTEAFFEVR